jgi:hypothetical protein
MLWRTVRPGGADCPHGPRGQSSQVPRAVRKGAADSSAGSRRQSIKDNRTTRNKPKKRTVREGQADRLRGIGPSPTEAQTVRKPAATKT